MIKFTVFILVTMFETQNSYVIKKSDDYYASRAECEAAKQGYGKDFCVEMTGGVITYSSSSVGVVVDKGNENDNR